MKAIKILLAALLASLLLFATNVQADNSADKPNDETVKTLTQGSATLENKTHRFSIRIGKKPLDCSTLPYSAYVVGDRELYDIMVPLRAVCEELGYTVGWDSKTAMITVDDGLRIFSFKNLSTEIKSVGKYSYRMFDGILPLAFAVEIHEGVTYVPLSFIGCLFTETTVHALNIDIVSLIKTKTDFVD